VRNICEKKVSDESYPLDKALMRFLIIEDEKRMALLRKKALEEENHSVVTAFAGE
jgi:hypothetical protein